MRSRLSFEVVIFVVLFQCSLQNEKFEPGLGNFSQLDNSTSYIIHQTSQTPEPNLILEGKNTHGCSKKIFISSDGPSRYIQGNVLGTYKLVKHEEIMEWPTWKMSSSSLSSYLYRSSNANGTGWLFGKANGNDVGWIKHQSCENSCPDSCSQNWMYWDDGVKEWYYDTSIEITISKRLSDIGAIFLYIFLTIVAAFVLVGLVCWCPCGTVVKSQGKSSGRRGGRYY